MSILVSGDDLIILIVRMRSFQLKISFSIFFEFFEIFGIFLGIIGEESQFRVDRCHGLTPRFLIGNEF